MIETLTQSAPRLSGGQPRSSAPGLSSAQMHELAVARLRMRKVARATLVAAISGWSLATFAALSIPFALFSLRAAFISVALVVIAIIELRGWKALRRLDAAGPRLLGLNQIGLAITLIVYGLWGVLLATTAPSIYAEQIAAGGAVAETLEPIDQLNRMVSIVAAVITAIVGVLGPGLTSLYYFTRTDHLRRFLNETPGWVAETLRITRG